MTELLCLADSYLREFEAVVTASDSGQGRVRLDRTAFYPGGGGQACDVGTLGGLRVVKVGRDGGQVWHWVEGGEPHAEGATVKGAIDWNRRYLLMRTHTALHVLCGVIWRDHQAQVTGGAMEPGRGRLDFELPALSRELVTSIEARTNEEVAADREIRVAVLPREVAFQIPDLIRTKINLLPAAITEVRTVEIVGLDLQADGGTHVSRTSEVGPIRLTDYKSKGALNKRIYLALAAALPP